MIVKKFPKNDDITIYPISDVHLGAAEYMANEWQAFCKKVLDNPKMINYYNLIAIRKAMMGRSRFSKNLQIAAGW